MVKDIKAAKLEITVEGEVTSFLGVTIDRLPNGTIKFSQPLLIEKILKALKFQSNTIIKKTPMSSTKRLLRHKDSPSFDNSFNYRSVIGMLNYLDAGSRSDIAYATHQCARFTTDPKIQHGEALRWLGIYLKGTKTQGMIFKPDRLAGIQVFVDADFSGN